MGQIWLGSLMYPTFPRLIHLPKDLMSPDQPGTWKWPALGQQCGVCEPWAPSSHPASCHIYRCSLFLSVPINTFCTQHHGAPSFKRPYVTSRSTGCTSQGHLDQSHPFFSTMFWFFLTKETATAADLLCEDKCRCHVSAPGLTQPLWNGWGRPGDPNSLCSRLMVELQVHSTASLLESQFIL